MAFGLIILRNGENPILPVNNGPVVIIFRLTELEERSSEDWLLDSLRSSSFQFSRKTKTKKYFR